MTPGWSPLEMYTIFTILVLSGHIPLEKFLKFNTLTISVTAKKTCLVDLCPKWCYSSYVSPGFHEIQSDPLGTFGRCSLCASLHRVATHGTKMSWDLWTRNLSVSWQLFLICCQMMSICDESCDNFGWLSNDLLVHCVFVFSQCASQIGLEFYKSVLFF